MANDKGGTPAQAEAEKAGLDALRALMFSVETNRFHQQVTYLRAVADRPDLKNDSIARMVEQLNDQVKEAKDAEREIPALVAMVRDARRAAEDALRYVEDKWAPINKEAPATEKVYRGPFDTPGSGPMVDQLKPAKWDDKYRDFLNNLRASGKINMFGAAPVLQQMFPALSASEARSIVVYWMKTFKEADEKAAGPAPSPALLASLFSAAVGTGDKEAPAPEQAEKGWEVYQTMAGQALRATEEAMRITQNLAVMGGQTGGLSIAAANDAKRIKGYAESAVGSLKAAWRDVNKAFNEASGGPVGRKEAGEKANDVEWARQLVNGLDHEKNAIEDAAMEISNLLRSVRALPRFSMPAEKGLPLHPELASAYFSAGKQLLLQASNAATSAWNIGSEVDEEKYANQTTDYTGTRRLVSDGLAKLWEGAKMLTAAARATPKTTKEAGEKAHPTTVQIGFDPLKGLVK